MFMGNDVFVRIIIGVLDFRYWVGVLFFFFVWIMKINERDKRYSKIVSSVCIVMVFVCGLSFYEWCNVMRCGLVLLICIGYGRGVEVEVVFLWRMEIMRLVLLNWVFCGCN